MKKISTFLLVLLLNSISMIQARTLQEAAQVANDFIAKRSIMIPSHAQRTAMQRPVELAYTHYQLDDTTPAFYIFNATENNGFVLVSAEDEARTILGYADNGKFDADNIPANMAFWLRMYAEELASVSKQSPLPIGLTSLQVLRPLTPANYPTVEPLLDGVIWGQTAPFNNLCPTVSGYKTPTGCAATAIAQIMYKHQYPAQGTSSHSYKTNSYKVSLSADFWATTYDWANMLPDYSGSYSEEQATAVATLMLHAGIAMDMDYAPNFSGAIGANAMKALYTYFGYDANITVLPKGYIQESDVLRAIATDLEAGRPVFMEGTTINSEGHAFVCDGMQSDGFLHINWGWDGISNGYFAYSALAPDVQGTGGSSSNLAFTQRVITYTGIQPNQGGVATPLVTVSAIERTSNDEIGRNDKLNLALSGFMSRGVTDAAGILMYHIYDSNDSLVSEVEVRDFELASGYFYTTPIPLSHAIPSNLSVGEYELEVVYKDATNTIRPILVKDKGVVRIPMTISESSISYVPQEPAELAPVTQAQIIYMNGTKLWQVTLYSDGFLAADPSSTDVGIQLIIQSSSTTSIVGTYVLDAAYSKQMGSISSAVYAIGISQACKTYTPKQLHLTISEGENGTLQFTYYMEIDAEIHREKHTIAPTWYMLDGSAAYYYDSQVTYDLAAWLTPSRSSNIAKTFATKGGTTMPYFVRGIVSNIRNTPEEITQYQSACFDISEDGTTANQLYCYNTRWLDNTDFTTGEEINIANEVVVLGVLQTKNGTEPEIQGYIYEFNEKSTQRDYSIKSLSLVSIEGMKVTFAWESEATMVEVRLLNAKNKQIGKMYTSEKQVSFNAPEVGKYTICVRPVDEDKQYLADEVKLVIEVDDYSVIDLALVNIEDLKVTVGWTTKAPLVEVRLLNANNKQIGKTQTSESQITFTAPEVGQYTIGVRPMDNHQQYLGEETTLIVVVTPTCVEDVATIATKTKKLLRNGQLLIIRDNKMYNVMGQEL